MDIICNICGTKSKLSEWTCRIDDGGCVVPIKCPTCKSEESYPDEVD